MTASETESLELASDLVDDIVDKVDVSNEVRYLASEYAERADLIHPINRSPSVVAASSVYLAGLMLNEKRTQEMVSDAADVSKPAIRDTYIEIAEHEDISTGEEESDNSPDHIIGRLREVLKL